MDEFWFKNAGYPQPNASGRAGDMEYLRQVTNICYVILDKSI